MLSSEKPRAWLTGDRCMEWVGSFLSFFFFFFRGSRDSTKSIGCAFVFSRSYSERATPSIAATINFISIQLATVNRLERANCVYIYINLYIQGERPWLRGLSIISDKFIRSRRWPICFNSVINHSTTLVPIYARLPFIANGWFASVTIPSQIQIINVK